MVDNSIQTDGPYESIAQVELWQGLASFEMASYLNFVVVQETVDYRTFYEQSESIAKQTKYQILNYQQDAKKFGLAWAQ